MSCLALVSENRTRSHCGRRRGNRGAKKKEEKTHGTMTRRIMKRKESVTKLHTAAMTTVHQKKHTQRQGLRFALFYQNQQKSCLHYFPPLYWQLAGTIQSHKTTTHNYLQARPTNQNPEHLARFISVTRRAKRTASGRVSERHLNGIPFIRTRPSARKPNASRHTVRTFNNSDRHSWPKLRGSLIWILVTAFCDCPGRRKTGW